MGIYARGNKLSVRYKDANGIWRSRFSGYRVGQEALAREMHVELMRLAHPPVRTPLPATAPGGFDILLLESMVERIAQRAADVVSQRLESRTEPTAPEWITVEAFAKHRSIARCTVRTYIKTGRLEAERIGRQWRIRRDAKIALHPVAGFSAFDSPNARARRIVAGPIRSQQKRKSKKAPKRTKQTQQVAAKPRRVRVSPSVRRFIEQEFASRR
jgi:excisionase family DNA binding protein